MKLEDQVVSLELARKLKALGVEQKSLFKWTDEISGKPYIVYSQDKNYSYHYSAFTVAELGEMLGIHLGEFRPQLADETEADYRAKMLIHLIESKVVEVPK